MFYDKLISSLTNIGISGALLNWFKDYLAGRKQRVVLDGIASDFAPVTSGVPQVSILGPLYTELFYAIIPTLFLCFLLICYPYILLHF